MSLQFHRLLPTSSLVPPFEETNLDSLSSTDPDVLPPSPSFLPLLLSRLLSPWHHAVSEPSSLLFKNPPPPHLNVTSRSSSFLSINLEVPHLPPLISASKERAPLRLEIIHREDPLSLLSSLTEKLSWSVALFIGISAKEDGERSSSRARC